MILLLQLFRYFLFNKSFSLSGWPSSVLAKIMEPRGMKLPLMAPDSDRHILNNQYCEKPIYIGKGRSPQNLTPIVTVQEFRTVLIRYSCNLCVKLPLMAPDSDRYILNNQYCEKLIYIGKGRRSPGNSTTIVTVQEFPHWVNQIFIQLCVVIGVYILPQEGQNFAKRIHSLRIYS